MPPLDVPPQRGDGAPVINNYSAVQLFAARLSALDSGFSARPENLALIAEICRHLDGIPLAIEFAAARAATLGLQQVADRLHDRFSLLTAGRRTALPRHQTLRATLDWSYELLPEPERALLRRLGIFVGGFTLAAATAVMGDASATASVVAEGIASLAVKSLVSLEASAVSGRWRLLETIRAYALDKLMESGEAEPAARRHAEFFRDQFAPARNLFSPVTGVPLDALRDLPHYVREMDNLRVALDWAFSRGKGNVDIAIGLALAAAPVFLAMSLLTECHRWSERAILALGPSAGGTADEMHLQACLGYSLMFTLGGSNEARAALDRGLAIAEELGDVLYQMRLLDWLNVFYFRGGKFRTALQYARRSSAVAAIIGDPAAIALAHFLVGNSLYVVGDVDGSRAELEATLQYRSHAVYLGFDQYFAADISLAGTLCLQGYPQQAVVRARRILKDAERIDNSITLSIILRHAVLLFLWIRDLQSAEELIEWYISIAQSHSLAPQVVVGNCFKGELAIRRGDAQAGVDILRASLATLHGMRYEMMASNFKISLAVGLAATGRFAEGIEMADECIRQIEENGDAIYLPELLRVKGTILLSMSESHCDEAEQNFARSIEVSRQQGARANELRAAIDLAKLMAAQGRRDDARALLEPIFAWFTEGLDTADMKSAEHLLATLR